MLRGMLAHVAPGALERLKKVVRRSAPASLLSTVWQPAEARPFALSELHPVLADPALQWLERPAGLDADFVHRLLTPSGEVLEPVIELGQMRQSATTVCFVVPVRENDPAALDRTLQSILRQTDPGWEALLCCDADDTEVPLLLESDWRVRRFVRARPMSSEASELVAAGIQATTHFVGLLSVGDILDDDLVKALGEKVRAEPEADLIYTDETRFQADGRAGQPFYKPDWSPEYQHSVNVLGRFVAIRKSLLLQANVRSGLHPQAAEYGLLLEMSQRSRDARAALQDAGAVGRGAACRCIMTTAINNVPFSPESAAAAVSIEVYEHLLASLNARAREFALRMELDWDSLTKGDQHSSARQALRIAELGLFDQAWYLSTYPDIKAAGFEPLAHYVNLGDAEGRRPNAYFDPDFYRSQFDRRSLKSVCALYHYGVMGEALGLKASGAFSAQRYLTSNVPLRAFVRHPLTHFLHLGRAGGLAANQRVRLAETERVRFEKQSTLPLPEGRIDPAGGINVIGPLDRVSGLGVSTRGFLEGLQRAGMSRIGCRAQQREFAIQESVPRGPTFAPYLPDAKVQLVHMNGDTLPAMIKAQGDEFLHDRYNIAIWYWELPTLRPEWSAAMKYFHEFWAPTPFIARTLRQSTDKPVHLVAPYLAYLNELRSSNAAADDGSHFVYCFDANSILERKNPGALLEAFQATFPSRDTKARLTFKVTYPNRKIADVERLYQAAEQDPRIEIIDRMLSDAELHALIGSATAYVSPHRSEGLGLTVIEAMAAGVPVISTCFGGVDAFVTPDTAYSIDHRLVELADDYVPYPQGFVWADPDVDSLAVHLASVHNDPVAARAKAAAARARVLDYFCSPALVDNYSRQLRRIAGVH